MLSVSLSGRSGSTRCTSSPSGAIFAISSSLRTEQGADDLAVYHGGIWHSVTSADSYDRVSIEQPCRIRFQQLAAHDDRQLSIGPFPAVTITRGVVKTTGSRPRLLAMFDDSLEQWRAFDDDSCWPVIVIEEALDTSTSAA